MDRDWVTVRFRRALTQETQFVLVEGVAATWENIHRYMTLDANFQMGPGTLV